MKLKYLMIIIALISLIGISFQTVDSYNSENCWKCTKTSRGGYRTVCECYGHMWDCNRYSPFENCEGEEPPPETGDLNLEIIKPINDGFYGEEYIEIEVKTNRDANIKYSIDEEREKSMCNSCRSSVKRASFSDGRHTLTVKATDNHQGKQAQRSVSFEVDSNEPEIYDILPEDGEYADGNFEVSYTEENLQGITFYWKGETEANYHEEILTNCEAGRKKVCKATVNLNQYEEQNIQFYFSVKDKGNNIKSRTNTVRVDSTSPVIQIKNPTNQVYNEKRVLLEITSSEKLKTLEYSVDGGNKFKRLCRNCDSYKRSESFSDGSYTLVIKATDEAGNTALQNTNFEVDTREPDIESVTPDRGYASGTFTIEYTEENLQDIRLYWKGESEISYHEKVLTNCEAGRKKECTTQVDLQDYEGQNIKYYFTIKDKIHLVIGKEYSLKVDTIAPILTITSPEQGKNYIESYVLFDLYLDEEANIYYSVDGGGVRTLCRSCEEYNRRKYFRDGSHAVTFITEDKAGNTREELLTFTVNTS